MRKCRRSYPYSLPGLMLLSGVLAITTARLANAELTLDKLPPQHRRAVEFAGKERIPSYVRVAPSGAPRIYMNVTGEKQIVKVEKFLPRGCNVLELALIHGGQHTLGVFDRELINLQQWQPSNVWRLNPWHDQGSERLRPSSTPLYSAMIHLTQTEGNNLRARIKLARDTQGADGALGDAFGPQGYNCASGWTVVPIGKNKEALGTILGISTRNDNPTGLQQELEDRANDRVFGICVYGPAVPNFGSHSNAILNTIQPGQ